MPHSANLLLRVVAWLESTRFDSSLLPSGCCESAFNCRTGSCVSSRLIYHQHKQQQLTRLLFPFACHELMSHAQPQQCTLSAPEQFIQRESNQFLIDQPEIAYFHPTDCFADRPPCRLQYADTCRFIGSCRALIERLQSVQFAILNISCCTFFNFNKR